MTTGRRKGWIKVLRPMWHRNGQQFMPGDIIEASITGRGINSYAFPFPDDRDGHEFAELLGTRRAKAVYTGAQLPMWVEVSPLVVLAEQAE